ncbi:FtsX-like permease family protein [Leptolyngbyaceae cyanobacterium CCMR0082]|uniref:FtsX-like permease family protein n=2 Tax=Adonisia turfae TaxID=2950184 RepID=A0A6M0S9H0_9CYAN|nr:ABC transporter permease DevC [Adonisia turfae]MDV3347382.1 ABC transporter permease DevC [Leptothoe sp. LEGE 181152]NEZ59862.1 DevC protein [Adonisia turfae CCMR0081]NEZ64956.1 FtsX-like permease family protein [Adonisia turfae CCMR0082]
MMNIFDSEAWLQLTHKKSRLFISLLSVTLSVVLMFVATALRDGIFEDAVTIHKALQADLFIQSDQAENFWALRAENFSKRVLSQISAIQGVASSRPLYFKSAGLRNPQTLAKKVILIFAFDPNQSAFNLSEINQQLNVITQANTYLYDQLSQSGYGPIIQNLEDQGSFITEAADKKIKIAGLFSLGGGILSANGIMVTSDLNFSHLFNHPISQVNIGLVILETGSDPQEVKQKIAEILPNGLTVLTKEEAMASEKQYWHTGSPIGFIFNTVAMMSSLFGGVIIYQILFTQISEYISVYATFKAIGYTNRYLMNTVLQESVMMAVLGFIPGVIICLYLFGFIQNQTRLPMDMSVARICTIFILTVITCSLASIIALVKLKDADPADLFR